MRCVRRYLVQDAESGAFLAPDGEGGVVLVRMLSKAVPFQEPDAAHEAVQDHLGGCGVVVPVYQPAEE